MGTNVKIAIVGAGMVGAVHAQAIRSTDGAELVCVHSRSAETGKAFAVKHDCAFEADLHALLRNADIDAVAICTPSGSHADIAILAARQGKHVLVEKPLDIDLGKADRAIEECRRSGVKLSVVFQLRFMPEVVRAKRILESGQLGKLIEADAYLKFYRPESYYLSSRWKGTRQWDGGGALMNQGIHGLDLLLWLAGPVNSVTAQVRTLRHSIEVEDTAAAIVQYGNGAIGVIQGTTSVYPDHPQLLTFHGTNGTMELAGTEVPYIRRLTLLDSPERDISAPPPADDRLGEAHVRQYQDFVESIRSSREPSINGQEGRKALELVRAIYLSSERRGTVEMPL
ncbi:Gfo/Idh/MocA family protein [Paenibacillus piri]|uniref:Gfo/Idh/MocA family oxidoreductase n=1 Tax=Paenibacillus piri TaxID=2547395 RepID=A0A4R5KDD9_9BACL|nr:Gfo/Idh/MocA family oxidoreductase [Paenibacillus piri]TDF93216.1 Gfo/Idh/MocA family oxidoreductase [Paenibacillus piri]